jgi:hypothetical protein
MEHGSDVGMKFQDHSALGGRPRKIVPLCECESLKAKHGN